MSRRTRNPYARPDHHTRAAKAAGYPARSVFKLEEIDRRTRLLRAGQHVLDLGAAPGSWSKLVAERIGPSGRLLSIDLEPIAVSYPPNVRVLQADVRELGPNELGAFAPYDLVLSDMAPRTTGNKASDAWRCSELYGTALDLAARWLEPGGSFVGKIFMGEGFEEQRRRTAQCFEQVRVLRPDTTRSNSVELFIVGLRAHPATAG